MHTWIDLPHGGCDLCIAVPKERIHGINNSVTFIILIDEWILTARHKHQVLDAVAIKVGSKRLPLRFQVARIAELLMNKIVVYFRGPRWCGLRQGCGR